MASLDNAFTIQKRLGAPVDLVILDDSYHIVTLDRQRHVVVDRAIGFAQRIERQRMGEAERPAAKRQLAD